MSLAVKKVMLIATLMKAAAGVPATYVMMTSYKLGVIKTHSCISPEYRPHFRGAVRLHNLCVFQCGLEFVQVQSTFQSAGLRHKLRLVSIRTETHLRVGHPHRNVSRSAHLKPRWHLALPRFLEQA